MFPASAQHPNSSDPYTTVDESRPGSNIPSEPKSPERATAYSLGGTLLLTPVLVGPIIGPSFGHFYAEANEQAWQGIGLRSTGTLLAGFAFLVDLGNASQDELSFAGVVESTSLLAVLGSAAYDTVTASQSAREYNASHGVTADVTPAFGPRGEQVGLALRISL